MLITEIAKAYESLALSPCQDEFYIKNGDGDLCCPLTVLALAEKAVLPTDPRLDKLVYNWAVAKYGLNKVLGFLDGWDWKWPGPDAPVFDLDYRDGFELGITTAKALVMD